VIDGATTESGVLSDPGTGPCERQGSAGFENMGFGIAICFRCNVARELDVWMGGCGVFETWDGEVGIKQAIAGAVYLRPTHLRSLGLRFEGFFFLGYLAIPRCSMILPFLFPAPDDVAVKTS
jgi:hypothetical protein